MTLLRRARPHRVRARIVPAAIVAVAVAACSPSTSTIGGWEPAALQKRADEATAACRMRTGKTPPRGFTTDGCSMVPDGAWQTCCVDHDAVYWCGGSPDDRRHADRTFRTCVADASQSSVLGTVYHLGVRAFAPPWTPFPWRWGYGWPWPYRDGSP